VELLEGAVVVGNIMTARLLVHEGGRLNGEIAMREAGAGSQVPGDSGHVSGAGGALLEVRGS
jgi:cytoskeletal protein CcmA (bactofilin family)